jgi:HSP20 family molecular chaperone IbpA
MEDIKRKLFKEFEKNDFGGMNPEYDLGGQPAQRPILFVADTSFSPPTDVWETEEHICVLMEIASMQLKDFRIEYAEGYLVIEGMRHEPAVLSDSDIHKYYKKEIDFGSFRVKIKMNSRIDKDRISANYTAGLLSIRLPKIKSEHKDAGVTIPVGKDPD